MGREAIVPPRHARVCAGASPMNSPPQRFRSVASASAAAIFAFLAGGIAVAFAFIPLTHAVHAALASPLHRWNREVVLAVHRHASPWHDTLAVMLTRFGANFGTVPVAALLAFLLARAKRRAHALAVVVGVVANDAIVTGFKTWFHARRPHLFMSVRPEHGYGYPSGHATTAVFLYGYVILVLLSVRLTRAARVAFALALLPLPLAVMGSRIYLGVHWPTDVAGGALAGAMLLVCSLGWARYLATLLAQLEPDAPRDR